ncbi:MAG: PDZ domain-containing protein, partial [Gammaproteobacteria bacterium]|nr:PDZ domain-containing protein [Gammaproteobacteria bacterium]
DGHVTRGWLGVLIQDVTRELAESFGMEQPQGALVAEVVPDSPAEGAGVRAGDIILKYGDYDIVRSSDLPPLVGQSPIGSDQPLKVLREGRRKTLRVAIAALPEDGDATPSTPKVPQQDRLGLVVDELEPRLASRLGIASGVVVRQVAEGAGQSAGILRGDVIVSINNQNVASLAQYVDLVGALPTGEAVPVLVRRQGGPVFLALKVPAAE